MMRSHRRDALLVRPANDQGTGLDVADLVHTELRVTIAVLLAGEVQRPRRSRWAPRMSAQLLELLVPTVSSNTWRISRAASSGVHGFRNR